MNIKIVNPEEYWDFIVLGRSSIVEALFPKPDEVLKYPFKHACYLIIFDGDKPIGFVEFFGYSQRFNSLKSCRYNDAYDLSKFGKFEDFCHCRSLYIIPAYQKNIRVYVNLLFAMASICVVAKKPFLTCTTDAYSRYHRGLYMKSGMQDIGEFEMGGSKQTLFFVELNNKLKEKFPFSRRENISSNFVLKQSEITQHFKQKLLSLEPSKRLFENG